MYFALLLNRHLGQCMALLRCVLLRSRAAGPIFLSKPPQTCNGVLCLQPTGPFQVTIVNRQYHMGRHMVNVAEVVQKLQEMPQVSNTRSTPNILLSWLAVIGQQARAAPRSGGSRHDA